MIRDRYRERARQHQRGPRPTLRSSAHMRRSKGRDSLNFSIRGSVFPAAQHMHTKLEGSQPGQQRSQKNSHVTSLACEAPSPQLALSRCLYGIVLHAAASRMGAWRRDSGQRAKPSAPSYSCSQLSSLRSFLRTMHHWLANALGAWTRASTFGAKACRCLLLHHLYSHLCWVLWSVRSL